MRRNLLGSHPHSGMASSLSPEVADDDLQEMPEDAPTLVGGDTFHAVCKRSVVTMCSARFYQPNPAYH